VHAAAELRPHRALAGRGAEDQLDRLVDVLLVARERDPSAAVHLEGKARPEPMISVTSRPYPRLMIAPLMFTGPDPGYPPSRP
jgi:hypothetical protein